MSEVYKKFWAANDVWRTGKLMATGNVMTPLGRISYANGLFEANRPKGAAETQEKKYSAQILFPPGADMSILQAAIIAAGEKRFGPSVKWARNANKELIIKLPIHDQGTKVGDVYQAGAKFINPGKRESMGAPGIVDAAGRPITDPKVLYSGCWVVVSVNPYAYDEPNQGISLGLVNVQKLGDDEHLGYTPPAATDEFAAVEVPLTGEAMQAAGAGSIFE